MNALEQPAADVLEQLGEQRPLRREVLVEHRLGDAGGVGDVVHRGGVEPAGGEHLAGDVEELAPALLGRESHRMLRPGASDLAASRSGR